MKRIRLGRTDIIANSLGFGALPLQRTDMREAVALLHRAVEGGVNFFDTARMYSDSETKLGTALHGLRQKVILATKSMGKDARAMEADLAASLAELRTDYLDVYQVHNAQDVPTPGDGTGIYELLERLKQSGVIRAIGLTAHSLDVATRAAASGLYDTIQFPFSLLASDGELALAAACEKADLGFIAMKGLGGGLITNIPAAFCFIARYPNVAPIWGMQSAAELEEFFALEENPPVWDVGMEKAVQAERTALAGTFCRSCGYCLPCPQDIDIPIIARMNRLLRRSPWQTWATPQWREKIERAKSCIQCGDCAGRCPYNLDPAALVAGNITDYEQFMREKGVL